MNDQVNDSRGRSKQVSWIDHWMQTNRNGAVETHNRTAAHGNVQYNSRDDNLETGIIVPSSVQGLRVVETKSFQILNGSFGMSNKSLDEGSSKNPRDWMENPSTVKDISLTKPKPLQETYVESSSQNIPYKLNLGKSAISSLTNKIANNQLPNPDPGMPNSPLLLDAPSTSACQLKSFGPELFRETKEYSRIGLFPSPCMGSEKDKSKRSDYGHYFVGPSGVHDVEGMRTWTAVDSFEGLPMFSHTTHSLVITKKTDISLLKEKDILRIGKINGNTSSDFQTLSPFFAHGNQGVRIQSLSSSTDSKPKDGNIGNTEASKAKIKNESSEETDTLDMDLLMEKNLLSGADSASSYKLDITSSRDVGCQLLKKGLPDINLLENTGPSSSRTQSLEMDILAPPPVELPKAKSKRSLDDDSLKADPSDRWVNRLKPSSLNSSSKARKISTLHENIPPDKTSEFSSRIIKTVKITSSKVNHEGQDFAINKGKELLLSHAWIQRWLSDESRLTHKKCQHQATVFCEPQSSKLAPEDVEKKQFPSIAAMAVMGKTISGFPHCELQKRGPFNVWNSKTF